jgi:hypothetical protein
MLEVPCKIKLVLFCQICTYPDLLSLQTVFLLKIFFLQVQQTQGLLQYRNPPYFLFNLAIFN